MNEEGPQFVGTAGSRLVTLVINAKRKRGNWDEELAAILDHFIASLLEARGRGEAEANHLHGHGNNLCPKCVRITRDADLQAVERIRSKYQQGQKDCENEHALYRALEMQTGVFATDEALTVIRSLPVNESNNE